MAMLLDIYPRILWVLVLLGGALFASTSYALSPAESLDCQVEIDLPDNQWRQISLPGDANSVAEIFADDISGVYRQDWAVFAYDAQVGAYIDPGETGALVTGIGYWIVQFTGNDLTLTVSGQTIIPTQTSTDSQCAGYAGGCIETPLGNGDGVTWSMIGQPLIASADMQLARIITDSGLCADADGCSIPEAKNANIFHDQLWNYEGDQYLAIDAGGGLDSADGFWCATLSNVDNPRILFPVKYGGYTPADQGIARFSTVGQNLWDEAAVRRVLHTFAYGGQANEEQIQAWANLSPDIAIVQMLTFDGFNPLLSPPVSSDSANLGTKGGTLRELGAFWSSTDADNDVDESDRHFYDTAPTTAFVYNDRLWERAVLSHGTNPFRQKIGLWETNYHMVANLNTDVTDWQMLRYYDDIVLSLADPLQSYTDTLTKAALSAAIAEQYGHKNNKYQNGECACNEDFAREYHQLFFGILGEDDPQYHESVTIKNTAKALTDMKVNWLPEITEWADHLEFGTANHWPGSLEILNNAISGGRADERISSLSPIAIETAESLRNLPEMIVRGLADDHPDESDLDEIRTVWNAMGDKNLLHFLRGYAISTQFHNASRVKYLSSFDRNLTVFSQTVQNNNEVNLYDLVVRSYSAENVKLFLPKHNVFGGQTGAEASTSSDIFRSNYNRATKSNWSLSKYSDVNRGWLKNWAKTIPQGKYNYRVEDVGEFLWNRYIGDGLKNYGVLERTFVNALLATNDDWAAVVNPNELERVFTSSELTADSALISLREAHANTKIFLDSSNESTRRTANYRVGKAINFISATPFMFAREGR